MKRLGRICHWLALACSLLAAVLMPAQDVLAQDAGQQERRRERRATQQAPRQPRAVQPRPAPPQRRVAPPPQRRVVVPPPERRRPPERRVVVPPPERRRPPERRVVVPPPPGRRPYAGYQGDRWYRGYRVLLPAIPLIVLPPLVLGYLPPPPPPPPVGTTWVVYYSDYLYLRQCPSRDCPIIGALQRGTPVEFLEYSPPYARVAVPDTDIQGWVLFKYLAPAP